MKTMTRPQGTAHAEHELAQLATRFQDWRHRRTTPSDGRRFQSGEGWHSSDNAVRF